MTRVHIALLGFLAFSTAVANHSVADDACQTQRALVTRVANVDVQKKWDVVVFKHFSDSSNNYIKRIDALPGEMVLIDDGQRCLTRKTVNAIKTQDATIEVTHDLIRIEGGIVEITRSVQPN
jgi:hypothetical protein